MAYEVTKRVGNRAYRYRVESYRDPDSQKTRSRWTYIGAVTPAGATEPPAPRSTRHQTRERLIDAFEALSLTARYSDVTADAVATRAGVAHGTFYRYFSDKRALLLAAVERKRRELDSVRPDFADPVTTRPSERNRVREWIAAVLTPADHRTGVIRAFYDAVDDDAELRALRFGRYAERLASLGTYLERLDGAGIASIARPHDLARALTLLVDGAIRAVFVESGDAAAAARAITPGTIDAFDRAIFATIATSSS